jgi:hypothetical protein
MKKLLILAIVMILSIVTAVPAIAAPPLHKVTGGGTVSFGGWGEETYGFTAIQVDQSGDAKGNVHFTWHYPSDVAGASPWIMQADVLYLAVDTSTGDAWIGGVITKSNDPYYVGKEFYLWVRDGGASEPDMIGVTWLGSPAFYALYMPPQPGYYQFEWTNGNVQLK